MEMLALVISFAALAISTVNLVWFVYIILNDRK